MPRSAKSPRKSPSNTHEPFARNLQHGQNRSGVELERGSSFDDYESALPFDPQAADERVAEEGAEIQARIHRLGHDVVAPDDDRLESNSPLRR